MSEHGREWDQLKLYSKTKETLGPLMNTMTYSQDFWNTFYENAWEYRRKRVLDLIESGESDPHRIIKQLEFFEKHNELVSDDPHYLETGEIQLNYIESPLPDKDSQINIRSENGSIEILSYKHLPSGVIATDRGVFCNQYFMTSKYTEYNKINFLLDYMRGKNFDAIIELGAGYSQNLIKLYYDGGPQIPYYGGEYTTSGTECAKLLAGLNPNLDLTNFVFDFNNPSYPDLSQYKNVLVFTCHTIEQVENLSEETLPSIANIAEHVTCIHFEPFGYQLTAPTTEVDKAHAALFEKNHWNKNLAACLIAAQARHQINLSFIGKNILGSSDMGLNPTSLAIWDNNIN